MRIGLLCLIFGTLMLRAQTARPFAPEVFPPAFSFGTAFAPDGKTVYVSIASDTGKPPTLHASRLRDGQWTAAEVLPFSGQYADGDPAMSPDGSRLFFWSVRPAPGKPADRRGPELWYAELRNGQWSEARPAGANAKGEWTPLTFATGGPSLAANGTLYCFRVKDKIQRLVRSKRVDGVYSELEDLGDVINSGRGEFDPYIAPDESYIIFASKRAREASDLYISFRRDGAWTPPRDLGPKVNSDVSEYCPCISPDSKRLYFTRDRQGLFSIETSELSIDGLNRN